MSDSEQCSNRRGKVIVDLYLFIMSLDSQGPIVFHQCEAISHLLFEYQYMIFIDHLSINDKHEICKPKCLQGLEATTLKV